MTSPTVLVLDGDLRSGLAAVRSIGRRESHIVCGSASRVATSFISKYVDERVVYPSPERYPEEFVSFIAELLTERGDVDVLLPVGQETTTILTERHDRLPSDVALPTPTWDVFQKALDKAETVRLAREANVPVPQTIVPEDESEVETAAESLEGPLVVKPRISSGSRGLRYVENSSDLLSVYRQVDEEYPSPLIQERIPEEGDGLGAAFLFDDEGASRAEFAYRRLREFPPSGGPSTLRESIDGSDVRRWGRELLEALGWTGVAMVEFKYDSRDEQPKLMEVNPRFWGSLNLPISAGVNFPWLAVQHAQKTLTVNQEGYDIGIRSRHLLPGDLLNLMARRDWQAFHEFFPLRDDNLYYDVLNRDDPLPTLGRMVSLGSQVLRPRVWRRSILRR